MSRIRQKIAAGSCVLTRPPTRCAGIAAPVDQKIHNKSSSPGRAGMIRWLLVLSGAFEVFRWSALCRSRSACERVVGWLVEACYLVFYLPQQLAPIAVNSADKRRHSFRRVYRTYSLLAPLANLFPPRTKAHLDQTHHNIIIPNRWESEMRRDSIRIDATL